MFKIYKFVSILTFSTLALSIPDRESTVPHLDERIVGGESVNITDYPYQVSLSSCGRHRCGGSIISNKYVVTATHCTIGLPAAKLKVRAGSSFFNNGGIVVNVSKVHQHSDYNQYTLDYDISVLELETNLTFGPGIDKIKLPKSTQNISAGTESVTSGWGAVREGGRFSKDLQAVKVPIVDLDECKKAYGCTKVTDRMICAGYPEGGKDSCQGDAGGPLVAGGELIGVVSWGYGCARPYYPGVYASVSNLRDFIQDVTGI